MYKWTKANKTMQKILRSRVFLSDKTKSFLDNNKEYTHILDVTIHAFRQEGDHVEVTTEWSFLKGDTLEKGIEFGKVVL